MHYQRLNKSDIPTALTIGTSLIIGLGLLGGFAYYHNFGINIFDFIDLSEAILLFFKFSLTYLLGMAITFLVIAFVYPVDFRAYTKSTQHTSKTAKNVKRIILYIAISILLIHISVIWTANLYLLFACIRLGLLCYIIKMLAISQVPLLERRIAISFFLGIFLTYGSADSKANSARFYGKSVVLKLEKDLILRTNADTIFVGNTKAFYFFYLPADDNCLIIKNENVQSIIIEHHPF